MKDARRRLIRFTAVLMLALAAAGAATPVSAAKKKDTGQLIWPQPPEKARLKYLETISSSDSVASGLMTAMRKFVLGNNSAAVQLKLPYGLATDSKGRLLVADYGLGSVVVFDKKTKSTTLMGKTTSFALMGPVGLAVGRDDAIFVSDSKLKRVVKFSSTGRVLYAVGTSGKDFGLPAGVAVDKTADILYVVDSDFHCVHKYRASNGTPLGKLGGRGVENGKFNFPTNVWVDQKTGNTYIADTMNFRVQIFKRDGSFIRAFGQLGDGPGLMARMRGLAIDTEGHVYVVDAAFNNFQIFTQTGQLLLWVGQAGVDRGQFNSPSGIYIDEQNKVYVADRLNGRVQVFQFLGGN